MHFNSHTRAMKKQHGAINMISQLQQTTSIPHEYAIITSFMRF